MSIKNTNRKVNKISSRLPQRKWLATLAAVLLVAAVGAFLWQNNRTNSNQQAVDSPKTATEQSIDLSPATEEDRRDSDSHKEDIVQQQNNPPTTSPTVTPVIDFIGFNDPPTNSQPEVDAHIDGVVENGGICTLTATLGSRSFTKTVTGVRNAQNTSCPAFILSRSDFTATGTWTVQVSYKSANYSGTSQGQAIKIQ